RDHEGRRCLLHARRHPSHWLCRQAFDAAGVGECLFQNSGADPVRQGARRVGQLLIPSRTMAKAEKLSASQIQTRLLIGGKWVDGAAGTEIDVFNPYDGSKIVSIAEAREADVDRAVEAARAAAPGWGRLAGHERARLLYKLADL